MGVVSVILFFLYCYGFGYTISRFVKNSEDFFERHVMRLGFGLGVFLVIAMVLNAVGIPLDFRIFLALSLVPFIVSVGLDFSKGKRDLFPTALKKSDVAFVAVIAIFFAAMILYAGGAFKYPYLENEDPWGHSVGAKYVSLEKKAFDTAEYNFSYMDPYPPGYDILMGVLLQTDDSVQFILKFFNALIISLGFLWFFFVAKELVGANKALFATFTLFMIPSFFTHFIWAHTLVIILFFPAIYAYFKIKHDKMWAVIAAILTAAILFTQPDQPLKLAVMIGMFVAYRFWEGRKFPAFELAAGFGGVILSLVWWGQKAPQMFRYATDISGVGSAFNAGGGSASRAYSLADFFTPSQSLINVPPGLGLVVGLLMVLGLIAILLSVQKIQSREKPYMALVLGWFAFTFIGTNSVTFHLPIGLNPFRFWLLLAIPVAIIAAEGAFFLVSLLKAVASINAIPFIKWLVIGLLCVGIFFTGGNFKWQINQAPVWYTALHPQLELPGYLYLTKLPAGTKVLTNIDESFIIGFDKYSCAWCPEVIDFKNGLFSRSPDEIAKFMKANGYTHFLFNSLQPVPQGLVQNITIVQKEAEIANSSLFVVEFVHSPQFQDGTSYPGAVGVFRVK